jgi:DHA2 family multidrug resistance protein
MTAMAAPKSRIIVAPIVGLAAFMEVLDISIANVALQHIAGSLAASPDEATWVLTSYLVTNAIVLPMSGWLSTAIGRKRYFLGCIVGFALSSLLCGLAPSLGLLIASRAIQGLTGGGLQPNAQAILADSFPPEKRGLAFAAYGLAVIVAPAIGPTLGGWITDDFSWRWVFLINVPVGILLFLLASRYIEDPPALVEARAARRKRGLNFDYVGFALLVIGMGGLQIVLDRGQEDDWLGSAFVAHAMEFAVAGLVGFVLWELWRKDPLVELRLLANRNFGMGNLLMFMLGFVLLGSTVLLPEFVQTLLGYTATDAGLVISPGGFATFLVMPLVGLLVTKVDARLLIGFGLVANAVALLYMGQFDLQVNYATVAWARAYQSIGLAFLFIPINTIAYIGMPAAQSNNASAIINMMRNLGGSIGISTVTTMLARRAQVHQNVLSAHTTPYSNGYQDMVQSMQQQFLGTAGSAVDALREAQGAVYRLVQQQAQLLAFLDDFRLLAVLFLALVPFLLIMRRPIVGGGPPPPAH